MLTKRSLLVSVYGSKMSIYSFLGARGIDGNGASARVFKKNFYLMTSLRTRIYTHLQ